LAARMSGIKKRIYTRHHSTFHHEYFPSAVKWDRLCNFLATDIVAISENVKTVLQKKEKVPLQKIHLIHHGFDLDSFLKPSSKSINTLKAQYLPTASKGKVIGVIGRYLHLKGHEYIIAAAENYLKKFPEDVFIF